MSKARQHRQAIFSQKRQWQVGLRITLLILVFHVVGCATSTNSITPSKPILDELMTGEDTRHRIQQIEQDLPSDKWITGPKSRPGRHNSSRSTREYELANELLERAKTNLRQMSAQDLLGSLKTFPYAEPGNFSGVAYYVYRDGNEAIIKELRRMSKQELESLRSFQRDTREIFTGDSGPPCSVGDLVNALIPD